MAGLAAHLAGAVASKTVLPVIGVPGDGGPLSGMDALLSTVQMPKGIPVATVAIGSAGAINSAYLAAQMLGIESAAIQAALLKVRQEGIEAIKESSLGSMLQMVGGEKALEPLKEPLKTKIKETIDDLKNKNFANSSLF